MLLFVCLLILIWFLRGVVEGGLLIWWDIFVCVVFCGVLWFCDLWLIFDILVIEDYWICLLNLRWVFWIVKMWVKLLMYILYIFSL